MVSGLELAAALTVFTSPEVGGTGKGEVLVDAGDDPRPSGAQRAVHGEARVGLGFGWILEDPIAALSPAIHLDFVERAPVRLTLGTVFALRIADRSPDQPGVLRRTEWDEVGDYFSILARLEWADDYAFGRTGVASFDLRVGSLARIELGHGSLLRGYHNGLDLDRRRTGVDFVSVLSGRLLEQPASLDWAFVLGDLAGSQVVGSRVGARWAGAGLGLSVVGDPSAPRELQADPIAGFASDSANTLATTGDRGVVAAGLDLSYRATDDWRWFVEPYLDLNLLGGLGQGLHLGLDGEVVLGRRRAVRLGGVAEFTYGSSGYDPAYFDVFYTYQRWQVPFVTSPDDAATDLEGFAEPKAGFVQTADLGGAGGRGAIRFAHDAGAFAEIAYAYRPGPLGHTLEARVGVDMEVVTLSGLYAHRGEEHGFESKAGGTLARLDLRVPVLRYLDVETSAGWTFAIRPHPDGSDDARVVTGGGFLLAGVAGRIPW